MEAKAAAVPTTVSDRLTGGRVGRSNYTRKGGTQGTPAA